MPRKSKGQSDNYNKAFPRVLRKLMGDMPQQVLANLLGKSRQSISYYRDGTSAPDWEDIVKIAEYFNVSTDYLLGRTEEPTPDATVQSVSEYTGLSAAAIHFLHTNQFDPNIRKFYKALIDLLLVNRDVDNYGDAPEMLTSSAFAELVHRKHVEKAELHEKMDDIPKADVVLNGTDRYVFSASEAAEFYFSKALNGLTAGMEVTLLDLREDIIESVVSSGVTAIIDGGTNIKIQFSDDEERERRVHNGFSQTT